MTAIGANVQRRDALAKVTGRALYPDDLPRPTNTVWLAAVRPGLAQNVAHATFETHDLTNFTYPGLLQILTVADVYAMGGSNRYGLITPDQLVLAENKIMYRGEPVALVLADSKVAARGAAQALAKRLRLQLLPELNDPFAAMQPDAPQLHPDKPGNIAATVFLKKGAPARVWQECAAVVEGEYHTPFAEHAYLQPEAGLARLDEDGRITLQLASQWPEEDLRQIALALNIPRDRLHLEQAVMGGSFGGREDTSVQIHLALAARTLGTNATIKMVWTREESLAAHTKRHPFHMRYRTGADKDGNLLAYQVEIVAEAGAYNSTSAVVLQNAATFAVGPYRVPHVQVECQAVYTNNVFTGAFRGFGSNQPCLAYEAQLDKLADLLKIDRLEMRRRNLLRDGDTTATGQTVVAMDGLARSLEAVAMAINWEEGPHSWSVGPHKRRGIGLACGFKNAGYSFGFDDKAGAAVEIFSDRVLVRCGAAEVGQGVSTILCQIAAHTLGYPVEQVSLALPDSPITFDAGSSSASRQTFVSGNAVRQAALEACDKLAELGGRARLAPGQCVRGEVVYHAPATDPGTTETQGNVHFSFSWASTAAVVEVDTQTGVAQVVRLVTAVDVGTALNPLLIEGQVEGGGVMGLGYTLSESFVEGGDGATPTFGAYFVPTALDAPDTFESVIIEQADPNGPYGARGIGEITSVPVTPAILAAIENACGARVDTIPATPERILKNIHRRDAENAEETQRFL